MKKLFYLAALAIAFFTASCSNDEDDNKFIEEFGLNQMYTVTMGNNSSVYPATRFTYKLNYSAATADITIKDVKFSPKMPEITMEIKNIPFSNTATGIKISANNLVPEVGGNPMPEYTITSLNCRLTDSAITNFSTSMLSFVVNNAIAITAYPVPVTFEYDSKTTVNIAYSSSTLDDFIFNKTSYAVYLNTENNLAQLYIYNAKFAEKMPAMNMIFPNIPFTATASGFELNCSQLIPTLNNAEKTPVENQAIHELTASISNGKLSLHFLCNSYVVDSEAYMFASEKMN